MELLLRRNLAATRGDTLDYELSGNPIRIGSEDSCDFLLPGLGATLQIKPGKDGGLRLTASSAELVSGNKKSKQLKLANGESAEFGGLTLRAFAPPGGFDAGLEVSGEVQLSASHYLPAAPLAPWSMRRVSWLLFFATLIAFLAVPLFIAYDGNAGKPLGETRGAPTDLLWSSGPLSAAHRAAGLSEDCAACHRQPFEMVTDGTCLDCHSELREHADVHEFASANLAEQRCGSCHREHNEPAQISRRDNPMCTDCHATPANWQNSTGESSEPVHAFTARDHPEFRLSHWQANGDAAALSWTLVRDRLPPGELAEQSGLKFNHEVHLNTDKVLTPRDEEPLACDSCHVPSGDGEHFNPISMDGQCRSCHTLNFDPFNPDFELPHGKTRAVVEAIEAHFIREFTDPILRAERARETPRRMPGKRMAAATCTGDGLACAREEAAQEATYQFADTGCVTCHEVQDTGAAAAIDRWWIHPAKLTDDWYPQSRFSHDSHRSLPDSSGDATCASCHEAASSSHATDVLIPGQDNCLQCHNAERAAVAVDCVSCHSFHRTEGSLSKAVREPGSPRYPAQ